MTREYGFYNEILYKYDQEIYDLFMTTFDKLPIGSIVNGRYLCIHGGISPHFSRV